MCQWRINDSTYQQTCQIAGLQTSIWIPWTDKSARWRLYQSSAAAPLHEALTHWIIGCGLLFPDDLVENLALIGV
jgi:hypothetical protein